MIYTCTKYESSGPCSFRKKIFESFILKTYLLPPWPTYATNWNGLNNFDRRPPRDHSCEVWSKSNKQFQRRCCLKKLLTDERTDGQWTTDNGPSQKLTLSTLCSGVLKSLRMTDDTCRTTTYDGQRPVAIAHYEHFVLRWAKKTTNLKNT